jgi:hypothetical protein
MTKIPMSETISVFGIGILALSLSLGHLVFEFVSHFDIRISDFGSATLANHASCLDKSRPSGVGFLHLIDPRDVV